jgi:diguanylate cyclase (GGDEF)-like protein/PAS domain S-box-containing protein
MSDVVTDDAGRPLGVVTTCEDISERRRAEQALRESEERYALAVRGANDGIWDWSLREDRLYVSPRWREMLGHGADELSASPHEWFARLHPEDAARVRQKIDDHLAGAAPHFEDEHRMRHKSGRYLWVLTRGFALRDADGTAVRMAGAQTDVTDRRAHDPLTGLPNRALMTEKLEQALARHQRRAEDAFAVLFVDLDHFKAVNDTLGHAAGDVLLMEVARRLESCLRPGDVVGRLAGDEFGLLLDRVTDVDEVVLVAERIQHELKQPFSWEGCPLRISASIGIAVSTTGYDAAEQILEEADAAMYRAKAAGRGRFELFDRAMRERVRERQRLVDGLRQALRREELRLVYQPIMDLEGSRLVALEALLRWDHPEGAQLAPPEVLALAEHTGQIAHIENWTLREACAQARRWRERAGARVAVAVNVSARQFRRSDLVEELLDVLAAQAVPPEDLWLDLTEACLVHNPVAAGHLQRLREAGVRVFLDDFGSGTAPVALLAEWALDGLKLDRPLVAALTQSPEPPLLTAIMAAAARLGLPMIAEGIESAVQRDRLRALGCALGQGTHFAPPLSADEAMAIIAANRWPTSEPPAGGTRPLRSRPPSSPAPDRPKPGRSRRKAATSRPTSS